MEAAPSPKGLLRPGEKEELTDWFHLRASSRLMNSHLDGLLFVSLASFGLLVQEGEDGEDFPSMLPQYFSGLYDFIALKSVA